jgi:hypothetical protein
MLKANMTSIFENQKKYNAYSPQRSLKSTMRDELVMTHEYSENAKIFERPVSSQATHSTLTFGQGVYD